MNKRRPIIKIPASTMTIKSLMVNRKADPAGGQQVDIDAEPLKQATEQVWEILLGCAARGTKRGHEPGLRGPDQAQVFQSKGHANGRNQRRQARCVAQASVGKPFN